jgi:hypothetical protein
VIFLLSEADLHLLIDFKVRQSTMILHYIRLIIYRILPSTSGLENLDICDMEFFTLIQLLSEFDFPNLKYFNDRSRRNESVSNRFYVLVKRRLVRLINTRLFGLGDLFSAEHRVIEIAILGVFAY